MRNRKKWILVVCAIMASACTSLGPMPALTMSNPVPTERASMDIQAGLVSGFFLSSAVADKDATILPQLAGSLDVGEWVGLDGLVVGGRGVGGGDSTPILEPIVAYRTHLGHGKRFALGTALFGTYAKGDSSGASYTAIRAGGEVTLNMRVTPIYEWVEWHVNLGASVTGINASGQYCMNSEGMGKTCEADETANAEADILGAFPTVFAGTVLHIAHGFGSYFHGLRLGGHYAVGAMPTVIDAERKPDRWWHMFGLHISMAFGAASTN